MRVFCMKTRHKLMITFLSLSLIFTPMVYAFLPPPTIEPFGSLPFRTINVDGDPDDWAGLPPLVLDPPGDASPISFYEDIMAVYGANDDDNLFFLMMLYDTQASPDRSIPSIK